MKNILLVHGSFHTGECWELLIPALARRGFVAHAPTLRGQRGSPRNTLLVSMKSYARDVLEVAEQIEAPLILLGHSLGGFVISEAAERRPELFSMLIYLTAAVPKLGKCSLRDSMPPDHRRRDSPTLKLRPTITFPPEIARGFFYNRCTEEVQQRAIKLLSPQPLRPLLGTLWTTKERLCSVKKHFIECAHDNVMPLEGQRAMQKHLRFESVQTLDTDHSPFFSNAEALADAVERISA
jgi:pimeloyl-ACP methyl ester carboxylesterase